MGNCLLRMAGIYFVLGVTLGLIGLIYKAIPAAAETKLAKAHLTHGGFVHPVTTCMTKAGILHG